MSTKFPKKVTTNDQSITNAETILNIKYPSLIREYLKERNGFYIGGYRFYCVLDKEDIFHTQDDVVKENREWKEYLPENHVIIANEDLYCLTLHTKKDGKVYLYNHEDGSLKIFANDENTLKQRFDEIKKEIEDTIK